MATVFCIRLGIHPLIIMRVLSAVPGGQCVPNSSMRPKVRAYALTQVRIAVCAVVAVENSVGCGLTRLV
jgi:hypothetical protein